MLQYQGRLLMTTSAFSHKTCTYKSLNLQLIVHIFFVCGKDFPCTPGFFYLLPLKRIIRQAVSRTLNRSLLHRDPPVVRGLDGRVQEVGEYDERPRDHQRSVHIRLER